MMKRYKWQSAMDWLRDHVDESRGDNAELFSIIDSLLTKLTNDDIQDLFQFDMANDGFFEQAEKGES
jgi:hypothetical protein